MKLKFKVFLILCLCTFSRSILASVEINGIFYDLNERTKTASVAKGTYSGAIVIPSTVSDGEFTYTVTSIGNGAFWENKSITSVTLPNTILEIRDHAFQNSSISQIDIPNSVEYIGIFAFSGSSLTSIVIPNSVKGLDRNAFEACMKLGSVTLSNSITCIKDATFYNCVSLSSITIPNSVTCIGNGAFEYDSQLTSVKFSANLESIGDGAFDECNNLKTIELPNTIRRIESFAFSSCSSLEHISIPNTIESIYCNAFYKTPWQNNQPDGLIYIGKIAYTYKGTMPGNYSIKLKEGTIGIAPQAFLLSLQSDI